VTSFTESSDRFESLASRADELAQKPDSAANRLSDKITLHFGSKGEL